MSNPAYFTTSKTAVFPNGNRGFFAFQIRIGLSLFRCNIGFAIHCFEKLYIKIDVQFDMENIVICTF